MLSANISSYKYLFLAGGHPEMTTGNSVFCCSLLVGGMGVEDAVAVSLIRWFYLNFSLLRLEFDHSHLEYFTELDAVLLVGTRQPIPSPEVRQICSSNLTAPIRKLTAQILQLNIHNISPQVGLRKVLKVSHLSYLYYMHGWKHFFFKSMSR
jgi:hypothetical protein